MQNITNSQAPMFTEASHLLSWRRGDFAERGIRCLGMKDERMIPTRKASRPATAKPLFHGRADDGAEVANAAPVCRTGEWYLPTR